MQIIQGISASGGIAIGKAFIYRSQEIVAQKRDITDPRKEIELFHAALEQATTNLDQTYKKALREVGQESADIFMAQKMILQDPDLIEMSEQMIRQQMVNADYAFSQSAETYAQMLLELPNEYMRSRAADVRDVVCRLVSLMNHGGCETNELNEPAVILAKDLTPADTIHFERSFILGFCTSRGGKTSHTAILARALGVPAVLGVENTLERFHAGMIVILDGNEGKLIFSPDEATLSRYQAMQAEGQAAVQTAQVKAHLPAMTQDGKTVLVVANIGNAVDAQNAVLNGAEGVGLLRTEFSFIEGNHVPSQEEMTAAYQKIFAAFHEEPILVRTLDIGGDKEVPHLHLPVEANPFLGNRGIRFCFDRQDLFRPQLKAILCAGAEKNLQIMFPMIATVQEVRQARSLVQECMQELAHSGVNYNSTPKIGIMIEVPAAALCADLLAKEVDFFSIGTNDLTQYTMAADRTNQSVTELCNFFQPAVLRLIAQIIEKGHAAGIWVGMCGEMAGDPLAAPLLLGMGLDEFSMNPPAIPTQKEILRKLDTKICAELVSRCLDFSSANEVSKTLQAFLEDIQ
jgi:phosphotransferase system enzyme I (PtsI)